MWMQIAMVSIGSALGGLTRWGVSMAAERLVGNVFPWGTLAINVTGSFFLGWFLTVFVEKILPKGDVGLLAPDDLRLLVAVGFTGAYTTFSTFEFETHTLWDRGYGVAAALYVGASVALGLLAVRLGVALARAL
ncbi:MAG: fluoride efflux transporter FluC [Planctomycetia bacterium]